MDKIEFKRKLKIINEALFIHFGLHNHYVIPIENQIEEDLFFTAFNELIEFGGACKNKCKNKDCIVCNDKIWEKLNGK